MLREGNLVVFRKTGEVKQALFWVWFNHVYGESQITDHLVAGEARRRMKRSLKKVHRIKKLFRNGDHLFASLDANSSPVVSVPVFFLRKANPCRRSRAPASRKRGI